jgi:hypothetical protein
MVAVGSHEEERVAHAQLLGLGADLAAHQVRDGCEQRLTELFGEGRGDCTQLRSELLVAGRGYDLSTITVPAVPPRPRRYPRSATAPDAETSSRTTPLPCHQPSLPADIAEHAELQHNRRPVKPGPSPKVRQIQFRRAPSAFQRSEMFTPIPGMCL